MHILYSLQIAQLEALVAALPEVLADKDDVKAQAHQVRECS